MNIQMNFYYKMDYFRRKARLIAVGHVEKPPATITYDIVVLRDTIRISLALSYLNNLLVKVAETQNAYISVPFTEKIWTVLGREFGKYAGKNSIVVRAIYGLKTYGDTFRNHLADCMYHFKFLPYPDDPYL